MLLASHGFHVVALFADRLVSAHDVEECQSQTLVASLRDHHTHHRTCMFIDSRSRAS